MDHEEPTKEAVMDIGKEKPARIIEPATVPVPARTPAKDPIPQRAPRREPATPSTPKRVPTKVPAR